MKKFIIGILIIAIAAIAYLTINQSQPANPAGKPVVKIGIIYPMSGDGAIYGETAKQVADMFLEELNAKNPHFHYDISFEDNQLNLAKTAASANKLIQVDKADVLVTVLSNYGAVVSPIAEKHKVLHFSVATDPVVAEGFYNFMASSNVEGETKLLYETLRNKGASRVDIVVVNATGPESMVTYFQQIAAAKQDLAIEHIYNVNADEKDFRTLLAKIKANNPDYVVVLLAMPTVDVFLKQYHEANLKIPFTGIETFTYLQNKELAEGMWYVDAAAATPEFQQKLKARTGSENTNYGEYLDLILQVVTGAYEAVQSPDKVQVGEYILKHNNGLSPAIGPVTVKPEGIIDGQPVLRQVKNNKIVPVE